MLKNILIQDQRGLQKDQMEKIYASLVREAEAQGVKVRFLPGAVKSAVLLIPPREHPEYLVISNRESSMNEAAAAGVAGIALLDGQDSNGGMFGVAYAVEDSAALNYEFINMVYSRFHGIPLEILRTKRCIIREISVADREPLKELYRESASRYIEPVTETELSQSFIRAYMKSMYGFYGYGLWLVIDRNTNRLIGRMGFENLDLTGWLVEEPKAEQMIKADICAGSLMVELGYMVSSQYQRKGIAREVCQALLALFTDSWGDGIIYSRIEPGNTASERLAKKLGFEFLSAIKKDGSTLLLYQYREKERKLLEN